MESMWPHRMPVEGYQQGYLEVHVHVPLSTVLFPVNLYLDGLRICTEI